MLELIGVNSFYAKAHILHDMSFSIGCGDVVALMGRNGAGKSTTLKSIMQLLIPRTGSVRFLGTELVGLQAHQVAKLGLGYVPEERRIFTDLTILENLEVGRQSPRDNAPVWTQEIVFELFPNLAERRNVRAKALSGGEQQMLTIARTLMGNPRLLLLDEPSEGIAPLIVEHMAKTILNIKREGLTVLISEQNLYFAKRVANRAVIIEGGQKRFDGTFKELNTQPEVLQEFLSV